MKVIARERYDLVYANNLGEVTRSAFWAARLTRRPFVWHIREPVRKKMAVLTVKYSDAVAANSSHTARAIISVTGYKTPVVIPNGVEPADFRTGRAEAREALLKELGWPEDSFLILNIGFLCERKNQIDAVEVIRLVTERHPEARLLCIGTPAGAGYDQRVRGRIDQGRLSDKVRLLGFRPSPAEYLLGADLLLHTSVNEPQGRVVLEAMAARLPVVAYRVGGIPEAVVECETGVLIPLGDTAAAAEATCLLIEDSERRLTMGQAGRDRVMRHFTAEATAHTVGGIIESVLSTRQKSRTRKRSS
jgi:glycosyltransferase involved in cell wall biosynthesis